jgi:hypothetical protein
VIVESDLAVLRPHTWVVVRHVPKHWVARPAATPAFTAHRSRPEAADSPDAFGPDPMDARPIHCTRIGARIVVEP